MVNYIIPLFRTNGKTRCTTSYVRQRDAQQQAKGATEEHDLEIVWLVFHPEPKHQWATI
jgi:hypothetical protein